MFLRTIATINSIETDLEKIMNLFKLMVVQKKYCKLFINIIQVPKVPFLSRLFFKKLWN